MSDRMIKQQAKSSSKKTTERVALVSFIEESGFVTMPCFSCTERGWTCRMSEGLSRYSEYVCYGSSYDGTGMSVFASRFVPSSVFKLVPCFNAFLSFPSTE
jgi:hypothetical protein